MSKLLHLPVYSSPEYALIRRFYGDKCARRSGVPLINHINEGVVILSRINADDIAARAFCLHPIVQNDADYRDNWYMVEELRDHQPDLLVWSRILTALMSYRQHANAYLAHHSMPEGGIRLSPLWDVNQMLIADKVQNYKDFLQYHWGKHPNSVRLNEYFEQWLLRLGLRHDRFYRLIRNLEEDSSCTM